MLGDLAKSLEDIFIGSLLLHVRSDYRPALYSEKMDLLTSAWRYACAAALIRMPPPATIKFAMSLPACTCKTINVAMAVAGARSLHESHCKWEVDLDASCPRARLEPPIEMDSRRAANAITHRYSEPFVL